MDLEDSRKQYFEGNEFWPADLVCALEDLRRGSALAWARESLVHLLSTTPFEENRLLDSVKRPETWDESLPDSLMERAERFIQEGEDECHFALAHMLMALYRLRRGEDVQYRTHLITALRFIGRHQNSRKTGIAYPLSTFQEHLSKLSVPPENVNPS